MNQLQQLIQKLKVNCNVNMVINSLLNRGLIIEVGGGHYRSIIGELVRALIDPRKDAIRSRHRLLGFRTITCELPVSIPTIPRVNVEKMLKSSGLASWPALWYEKYYPEQENTIKAFIDSLKDGSVGPIVLSLPTGSGKTEAFLIPVLAYASQNIGSGVKALLVYPRKALETDQLRRLIAFYVKLIVDYKVDVQKLPRVVVRDGLSVRKGGQGQNRYSPNDKFKRFESIEIQSLGGSSECKVTLRYRDDGWLRASYKCNIGTAHGHIDFIPVSDDADLVNNADILLLNYDMLYRLITGLSKPTLYDILDKNNRVVAVFDEAHEYQGIRALYFLAAILGLLAIYAGNRLFIVISSATLPDPQRYIQTLESFLKALGLNVRSSIVTMQTTNPKLRRVIPVIFLQADPQTAADWLLQLVIVIEATFLEAIRAKTGKPFKSVVFIDSVQAVRTLPNNIVSALINPHDYANVLDSHYTPFVSRPKPVNDPLDWRPEIDMLLSGYNVGKPDMGLLANTILSKNPPLFDVNSMRGFIAQHYAGMTHRSRIEEALRRAEWPRIVIATPTLEVGIDVRGLLIVNLHRVPPNPASAMQRVGRVGRSLEDTLQTGLTVVTLANTPRDTLLMYDDDMRAKYFYGCYSQTQYNRSAGPFNVFSLNVVALKKALLAALLALFAEKKVMNVKELDSEVDIHRAIQIVQTFKHNVEKYKNELLERFSRILNSLSTLIEGLSSAVTPHAFYNELLVDVGKVAEYEMSSILNRLKDKLEYTQQKLYELKIRLKQVDNIIDQVINTEYETLRNNFETLKLFIDFRNTIRKIDNEYDRLILQISSLNEHNKNVISTIHDTLSEIEALLEDIIDEAQDIINNDYVSQRLPNVLTRLTDIYDIAKIVLDEIIEANQNVRDLVKFITSSERIKPIELLAVLTGKPWYSGLLESSGISVKIEIGSPTPQKPITERDDDAVRAAIRLTPLSLR